MGIGGLNKDALVYEAKIRLYKSINIKQGQALANISVDWRNGFYILFSKTKVTLSADIIEFLNEPTQKEEIVLPQTNDLGTLEVPFNEDVANSLSLEDYQLDENLIGKAKYGFIVGEEVKFKNKSRLIKGRISNINTGTADVKYFVDKTTFFEKRFLFDQLTKINPGNATVNSKTTLIKGEPENAQYGFEVGERVEFKHNLKTVKGVIEAFMDRGFVKVLYSNSNGNLKKKKVYYKQINKIE